MKLVDIEKIVRQGAASLAESLHFYWPSSGESDIQEGNITLHLGGAFLNGNFLAYSEANLGGKKKKLRIDLLAIDIASQVYVVAEFKRLHFKGNVEKLVADANRIKEFELQKSDHPGITPAVGYGLIAATTWKAEYAGWFTGDAKSKDLEKIFNMLPNIEEGEQMNVRYDAFPLASYHYKNEFKTQWLVYVLFKLPSPKKTSLKK